MVVKTMRGKWSAGRWRRLRALGLVVCACVVYSQSAAPGMAQSLRSVCNIREIDALLQRAAQMPRETKIDAATFYQFIKSQFSIYQKPGDHYVGTDALLHYWNNRRHLKDLRWLAYAMGTSYHETARRMYPVRETLARDDATVVRILARSAYTKNKTYWKKDPLTGQHYYGRGYVQLTWKANYQTADKRLQRDQGPKSKTFLWNAERALDPDDSVQILFDGMIYGWYTGKHCLPYYFDPSGHRKADWKNARRIVNVLDRWLIIADHSKKFLAALEQAQIPIVPPPPSEVADPPTAEPTTPADVAARLVAAERARADAQTQLQAMTDEIARVSKSNEGLRQQITRMADQAKTRQEIFAALRADDAAARQRIEELKSAKADAAAENGELRAANAGLSERISAQNTQIAALRTHIEALSDSNGVETDALAAENQRLTAQNTTLRQKVGQLDKRLDDVSSTLDAMRAINESLEAESRQAAHDRELVLAERADIRAQVTDKERRIAQLGALKHTLQRQVTSLEARLSAATAERDAMKAELEKSWWNFW